MLSWAELQKCAPTILVPNCDQAICLGLSVLFLYATLHKVWLFEKFNFELEAFSPSSKINFILVRQIKSLKKMAASSANFAVLILWSPICMSHISISENYKYLSQSNA